MLTNEMVACFTGLSLRDDTHLDEGKGLPPMSRRRSDSSGNLTAEQICGLIVRGHAPRPPLRLEIGLDSQAQLGKNYWGGALFCLWLR